MRVTHTPGSAPADGKPTVPRPSITPMLLGQVMTKTLRVPFTRAAAACLAAAASLWAAPCAAARVTPELVVEMPSSFGSDYGPSGPLVQGADGQIYFTNFRTTTSLCGAITAVDPVRKIARSLPVDAVACGPSSTLTLDDNGDLWGSSVGLYDRPGTLFRVTPHGVPTVVYAFPQGGPRWGGAVPVPWTNQRVMLAQSDDATNAMDAYAPPDYQPVPFVTSPERTPLSMIQRRDPSADAALYGLDLTDEGTHAMAVLKRLDASGTLSTVGAVDRCGPSLAPELTEGRDGYFYVNCGWGGPTHRGNIIRLSPTGEKTTIHIFGGNGKKGSEPTAGVIHASDGWLYGSTENGGFNDNGVIYRLRPDGSDFQVLFYFTGGRIGFWPTSRFVQATDGMVYGRSVGRNGTPVIFRFALPR
jgi:uncharacterized repeat protein (TIGR03803 family)